MFAHRSGGHFNPAFTLGVFSLRRISLIKTVMFVAMQAVGAVLAWKLFEWFSPDRLVTLQATEFDWKVFTAEFIGTAIFAMAFAAVILRKLEGGHAGAVIGLAFFAAAVAVSVVIVNRQIVTGYLNPAVALGNGFRPENQAYLAYFFGPVLGAVVGMNLYQMLFTDMPARVRSVVSARTTETTVVASKPAAKKPVAKKRTTKRKTTTKKK